MVEVYAISVYVGVSVCLYVHTLCISGFVDAVMSSHNGANWPRRIEDDACIYATLFAVSTAAKNIYEKERDRKE